MFKILPALFSVLMFTAAAALAAYALSLWVVMRFAPFDLAPLQPLYGLVWGG